MKNFLSGILFCVLALTGFAQNEYVDSLRQELCVTKEDTVKVAIYKELFDYYSKFDNNIADCYADTILLHALKCKSYHWLAVGFRSKGIVKEKTGDFINALTQYEKAEKIAKKINDCIVLYKVYNDIGNIYNEYSNAEKSIKYFDLAIEYAKKIGDNESLSISLVNKASIYYATEKYDTIFLLYDSALNVVSDVNTKIAIYNNLAYLQYITGNIEDSKNTTSKILLLLNDVTDKYIYVSVLNSISSIYIQEGEYEKALNCLSEVDSICRENNYEETKVTLYQRYKELYVKMGNYEKANYYLEEYYAHNDSIYSNELAERLNDIENRHQREKAELEMKILDEEISHQKTLNAILFSIIAIVLIFIAVIAFLLVKKNRLNRTLNKLNSDLKQRDEEISTNLDYAREIQLGCMGGGLSDCNLRMFVLDLPKITVGGDFHIAVSRGDVSYVVVGDCTGHGISGGFLSVLGIKSVYSALEKYDNLPEMASFINNEFCKIVSSADNLKGESLCLSMLRIYGNEVRFLGSKQKMWLVSDGEVREYKSSNAIMGGANDEVFMEEIINVKSGDVVFLSSDGYPDQFGADGKLKYPRFRNILLECSHKNPEEAKAFLSQKLDEWRGNNEQTDDVMVVGIYF